MEFEVIGKLVDINNRTIYNAKVSIKNGVIDKIIPFENDETHFILPGFIDAHIHIESSMVTPFEFSKIALKHGTVATVSDPHEIANVCGMEGIQFMIDNGKEADLKFFFGAPSCVPATSFESAGATIDSKGIETLMRSDDIWYLSEMMNYPGVLYNDPEVLAKIQIAKNHGKPIDGHAPGLRGEQAKKYIQAGISTDHECTSLDEALEKLQYGMKIIIREGSAAKNYNALHSLIKEHSDQLMFCSDDKHPDDLLVGHINLLVKRSIELGYDLFDVLKMACLNPIKHYGIPVGRLKEGDSADFILVDNLKDFKVLATYINGINVLYSQLEKISLEPVEPINQFNINYKTPSDYGVKARTEPFPVIQAIDGSLITEKSFYTLPLENGFAQYDFENDIIKIAVVNRYSNEIAAVGFIQNFGLKDCAIASTVAHDSHNIIVVGCSDEHISTAVNLLIKSKGGLSAVNENKELHVALPIAGLMSDKPCDVIGKQYEEISNFVKQNGCKLSAPYMTLSFMALLVIPKIKISDKGMFDAESFKFY